MPDQTLAADSRSLPTERSTDRLRASRSATMELESWLRERVPALKEQWVHEIHARELGNGGDAERVVEAFTDQLVDLLPSMLGPHREQIRRLWDRGAELFGAVAAKRGLAAGEAIEEIHILRELVIRDLYRDPPPEGSVPLSLREILRLNRALDRAVTHASVGHTDALFFEFFEGEAGASLLSGDDVAEEAAGQLAAIRDEVRLILEHANGGSRSNGRRN